MLEDRIDYFALAYEQPNFSAAAARVPMSPQGFSKAIRNLERELGVSLFVVDESGVRKPTPYADVLYDYAQRLRYEKRFLEQRLSEVADERAKLDVVASLGTVGLLGEDLLNRFRAEHPEIALSLVEMPDEDCEDALSEGLCDIALMVSYPKGGIEFSELYSTHVCLWTRSDNPLYALDVLALEDLALQRIAMPGHRFKCYERLVARMADAGLPLPQIDERCEMIWVYEEAACGHALGFALPYMTELAAFSHNADVRAIPVEGSRWGFGVAHAPTLRKDSNEWLFKQHILSSFARK